MIMQDKIEKYGEGSVLQHGRLNNRVYLIKLDKADFPQIIHHIDQLAKIREYTKIFCKVPAWASPRFISDGFIIEAHIPHFYHQKDDAFFMSKFLDSDRSLWIENAKLEELAKHLISSSDNKQSVKIKTGFKVRSLKKNDVEKIVVLYKQVFKSYPFPIFDPDYIIETFDNNVQYYGIENNGNLIALSSAEIDKLSNNVEMTDFAILPEYRGNKFSVILLKEMEKDMKIKGIKTLYTIARLNSIAMNRTFLALNYKYAGTLINNTNIMGKIESMNVLYKHLS